MIDFHSHIIYGIDDGAENIEMSLEMLENSKDNGTTTICATSHYICGMFEQNKDIYFERLSEIQKLSPIQVVPALEIRMHDSLIDRYENGLIWGINNGPYMLLEFPFTHVPKNASDIFYEFRIRGIKPILAHPERYYELMKKPDYVETFISDGVLMQVNADSILGKNGKQIQGFAKHLIKHNMAHFIGSDGHDTSSRPTDIKNGLDAVKKINPELFDWMNENQYNVINGTKIIFPEIIKKKRRWF